MLPHGRASHGLSDLSAPPMPVEYCGEQAVTAMLSKRSCPRTSKGSAIYKPASMSFAVDSPTAFARVFSEKTGWEMRICLGHRTFQRAPWMRNERSSLSVEKPI